MNTTELIVELVLAGWLMLVALVLPFGASRGGFLAPDEGASVLVVLAIAGGFVLGVIIDRAADSLLEGWLGYQRLRFATDERIAAERTRLVHKSVALADPFPENWMRDCLMQTDSDAIISAHSQLRVRIRVTRNLIVLVPALTTSTAAAVWIHLDQIASAVTPLLIPLFHLGALLVLALLASIKALRPLRTEAHRGSQPTVPWLHVSPAILWLAAQLFASLSIAFQSGSDGRPVIDIVLLLGATLTTLAIWAWWRLNETFMGTVWNYCRFNERAGLIRAMTGGGAPPAER